MPMAYPITETLKDSRGCARHMPFSKTSQAGCSRQMHAALVKIAHVYIVKGPLLVLSQAGLQTVLKHMHACTGKRVTRKPEAALAVLG